MLDPTKHNYYKKIMKLHAEGKIPTSAVTDVQVAHDDSCGIYRDDYCDCDPDIRLRVPAVLDPDRN